MQGDSLKTKTARTVKWNLIDRIGSQLLYAVTGIVLARELSQEAFGLVGAVLVFQSFASLLVDSGFLSALLQRKNPSRLDYSSVLWFNLGVAVALYIILWFCAPAIADFYQGDQRIVPLARVIFLSLVINAGILIQNNILMKRMDVGKIALANVSGLTVAAVVGISLALTDFGPWAIVWQTITLSVVRFVVLWSVTHWRPMMCFSWPALKSYLPIASRMMLTSFLSTLFQNIYSLIIGNRVGMVSLGYYTQSDKWSKMSITTLTQTLTSSVVPPLAQVQDEPVRFANVCSRFNRLTAYVLFPLTIGLIVLATPLFHLLFGDKWDPSIILFQLLMLRGVFTVLSSLYNNFLLASGRAKAILSMEILRDVSALFALAITLPWMADMSSDNPVDGLAIMLLGQLAASFITWVVTLVVVVRNQCSTLSRFIFDLIPYFVLSLSIAPLMYWIVGIIAHPLVAIVVATILAIGLYIGANAVLGSKIQREAIAFIRGKSLD